MRNYRNNNRNRRSRSSRSRNRFQGQRIDINKFIKEAKPQTNIEETYIPDFAFQDLNIPSTLKRNIASKGFETPTPIQNGTIPHILENKDVVGIANTGTGKTGAFLIPIITKLSLNPNEKVMIIAPTRELAEQIDREFFELTKGMNIFSVLCIGGANIFPQIRKLQRKFNVVVGTPGRITDLSERRVLNLGQFSTVVLDEVDRMLDMGFVHDIKNIIGQLSETRQSLFFSATITPQIENIMREFVHDYIKISVKTAETSDNVHQNIVHVKDWNDKIEKLEEILEQDHVTKTIVFVRTKIGVEKLDDHLYNKGYRVDSLHGNKSQGKRKMALDNFKKGRATILIATDVAARGLDVNDISHVINYDMPDTYDDYVHRIGRTGRASKIGHALTFVETR